MMSTTDQTKSGLVTLNTESAYDFARLFEQLFNVGDYISMASYYMEDADLIGVNLPIYKGTLAIQSFWKKTCTGARVIKVKRTIHVDNVRTENELGYISGAVNVKFKILFIPIFKKFRFVTIWKKQGNLWRLAIDISTKVKKR